MEDSPHEDREQLQQRLEYLRDERQRTTAQLRTIDLQAGRLASTLTRCHGLSYSAVARHYGVSQPHVPSLIARYDSALDTPDVEPLLLTLPHSAVLDYLEDFDYSVSRIVAARGPVDMLVYAGLEPSVCRDGERLAVPQMLLHLYSGATIGVTELTIGYRGTGPGHAYHLLRTLGADEEQARLAYTHDLIDLRADSSGRYQVDDGAVGASELPLQHGVSHLRAPTVHRVENGGYVYVAALDRDELPTAVADTLSRPRTDRPSPYEQWLELLSSEELPDWIRGERVARVYTSRRPAQDHGFVTHGLRPTSCQVVLQQGRLQLWLPIYPPLDETSLLTDEAYAALALADLYPDDMSELDWRTRFGRYLRSLTAGRPGYVDVSPDAKGAISWVPASDATADS